MKRSLLLVGLGIFLVASFAMGIAQAALSGHWARSYVAKPEADIWFNAVQKTMDEGFIVAGNAGEAGGMSGVFLIMKLNADGTVKWERTYHHSPYRQATCIEEVNGEYFVAGYTFEGGNLAALVMKLNDQGGVVWERIYADRGYHIIPSSILDAEDGGVAIAGRIEEIKTNNQDFWVMKLQKKSPKDYVVEWQKAYDYPYDPDGKGERRANETAVSIARTAGGGYLVTGHLYTPGLGYDPWIVELENNGDLRKQARIKSPGDNTQVSSMVRISDPASKDMFVMTGFTNSSGSGSLDMFASKLEIDETAFHMHWKQAYGLYGPDYAYSVDQTRDGDFVLAGSCFMPQTNSLDALILKLRSSDGLVDGSVKWWSRGYGGVLDDGFYFVQRTAGNEFVVGGYNESLPDKGFKNAWVMKLDYKGEIDGNDACMRLERTDPTVYALDWVFGCLPGYKPIDVKTTSVIPKEIKSTPTDFGVSSSLLCDQSP